MNVKSFSEGASNLAYITLAAPVIVAAMAVAPMVGLLAQPILAIQAIFYAISQNFHFNKTKDENGLALADDIDPASKLPRYMNRDIKFTATDITRLKHERDRLKARNNLSSTMGTIKEFAKLMIPVIGLVWHLQAARNKEALNSKVPFDQPKFDSDLSIIEHHIRKLTPSSDHQAFWNRLPH
ncbi:MAG: hypothetical protein H0W50_11240 [Parachlamydiaceae bacterium]|nr:hypothetical protein [Parachlamydiaceae bacterium]